MRLGLRLPDSRLPDGDDVLGADWNAVERGFFRTMTIRLVRGRDFTGSDTFTAPKVAIVNEALAGRAWPGQDPIGRRLIVDNPDGKSELTVIGVASDARLVSLDGAVEPYLYLPMAQQAMSGVSLVVKARGPVSAIPQMRALLRDMNSNLPVTEALSLGDVTSIGLVPQRMAVSVAGTLGLVGLLLAAIGIYGVTAFAVSRRTREIGIRMALGADQARVLRLVLRQGFMLGAIGIISGVAVASAGATLLESLLFGIRGLDPPTFGSACLILALVTLLASYIPARRATRVDPAVALRSE
jgi:putative ABC transport system permease protein